MTLSHRQKLTIISLVFYWPTLFILAHIPIPLLVRRAGVSDKCLHFLAYLILTFLLWFAISPDKKVNWRRATVWWVLFVVAGYGVADELLQSYVIGRGSDVMDFAANLAGMLTGLILFSLFAFWPACLLVTAAAIFGLTNLTRVNLAGLLPVTNTAFHFFAYAFFTMLWIQNISRLPALKASELKWLIVTSAVPAGLLFSAKAFSILSGRYFAVRDVIVSVAAIAAVVVTVSLVKKSELKCLKKVSKVPKVS